MKRILVGILLMAFVVVQVYADNSHTIERLEQQISDTEAEIARLQALLDARNRAGEQTVSVYTENVVDIRNPLSQTEFVDFCNQNVPSQAEVAELLKKGYDCRIVTQCAVENGVAVNRVFVGCLQSSPSLVQASDKTADMQQLLRRKRNTLEMWENVLVALDGELSYNTVDIVDQMQQVFRKQVNIPPVAEPLVDKAFEKAQERLRQYMNVTDAPIENEIADITDELIGAIEQIPGLDKVSKHYLYQIFKNSPQIGKTLGDAGALVSIYFQKRDVERQIAKYKQEIAELERLH
ncbi:MAG TPA: hypothetical protein IAA88_01535 [Candidatus Avimuribaculum pullicola]|nr:hypothetical protein [Candidatus Avimuribaculum pullicola]